MPFVFLFCMLALVVVIGRLVYLQLVVGETYAQRAANRRSNVQVLQARRGTIYDRNGNVLAASEPCYDVYCNPQEIKDPNAVAKIVAQWLGGESADYVNKLGDIDQTFVYLKQKADRDASEKLRNDLISQEIPGVYLLDQTRRVYPYGGTAGQILGKVDMDGEGVSGLELMYNDQLAGTNGEQVLEVGSGGTPIAGAVAEVTPPEEGKDIILSIDVDVQRLAEEETAKALKSAKAKSGFCMVTDPRTGEILASCSTPYADLTKPDELTPESLNLRMVSDSYEPGSIFKVLTAAIGLESGLVKTSDYFAIPGRVQVGDDFVADDDGRMETMDMNLREIMRRSSNAGVAQITQEVIGEEKFAEGIERFGIGHATGIDYPGEAVGIVKKLEEYDASSAGSMSFGQGLSIPMVQMVKAVGAVADGGTLHTPHFATSVGGEEVEWPAVGEAISEDTAEKVADMMVTVVEEGTATTAAVKGFDVAAKTGTGEQSENGRYMEGKYMASLIGFAPAQKPEVLVYVGLNETPYLAYSSAGPAFSAIMGEVLTDMGVLSTSRGL